MADLTPEEEDLDAYLNRRWIEIKTGRTDYDHDRGQMINRRQLRALNVVITVVMIFLIALTIVAAYRGW